MVFLPDIHQPVIAVIDVVNDMGQIIIDILCVIVRLEHNLIFDLG
jgi:hypothetical protein